VLFVLCSIGIVQLLYLVNKTDVVHYQRQCQCMLLSGINTQSVLGKFCGTVCSWAKANLEKMPQQVMGLAGSFYHKKSRPRNSKTLICCWSSPGSGHPNSQLQASAMASPPEREVAALESCFRYLPADAVPAVVDCVLASSTSSSPSQLFHALLRSSPPSQVV